MNTPTARPPQTPQRPLWLHLWGWAMLALAVIWVTLAGVAFYTGVHEAEEITDGQLVSSAELLLRQTGLSRLAPMETDGLQEGRSPYASGYSPELRVVAWDNSELVWDTHSMARHLPSPLTPGHHTLDLPLNGRNSTWRVFVGDMRADNHHTHRVAVMIDTDRHAALGRDIAEHIVRPALVLLPLVALLLGWTLWQRLRPLSELSDAINALDIDAGETLPVRQPFPEMVSTVRAINGLVERLQALWLRERRFTSDVAHELRTPLAALVLQSHLAHEGDTEAVRKGALQQIERESLRAGRILSQLLDLARAQGPDASNAQPLDLCALARQVTEDHVPKAFELGQELLLEVPEQPVMVLGRAAMLELALRNLVDNALRHTPSGTQVEVRVRTSPKGAMELSVSDDGAQEGAEGQMSPGMGIGLTLVQRIADAHGAQFVQDTGIAPFTTRYQLVWPAA